MPAAERAARDAFRGTVRASDGDYYGTGSVPDYSITTDAFGGM
jgi:hypothetical protein